MAASKGERHPTEIASLMGKRQVTAHESGEGVLLREDFIKQATGSDRLSARFMREDFFDFAPTHKLQLLTNHKPQVKGQDQGIWRRVQLVPYLASFGTAEQVANGERTGLRDVTILEKLREELAGVLAWRVRGAMAWAAGGLQPPGAVAAASAAYKQEQDRVGQFVSECCERGERFEAPVVDGMGGLYPEYVAWCKESGTFALSKARFVDDVLRVVGVERVLVREKRAEDYKRKKVQVVPGLRLLED
jgi:putative DNA primase/helicase